MIQFARRLPSPTVVLTLALAAFTAGCGTTRHQEQPFLDSEKAAALVGKLDEALIGTSGPTQVEEAIEETTELLNGTNLKFDKTFPLKCSPKDLHAFIDRAGGAAAGWISFYWGTPPEKLRGSKELKDAILLDWLDRFGKRAPGGGK